MAARSSVAEIPSVGEKSDSGTALRGQGTGEGGEHSLGAAGSVGLDEVSDPLAPDGGEGVLDHCSRRNVGRSPTSQALNAAQEIEAGMLMRRRAYGSAPGALRPGSSVTPTRYPARRTASCTRALEMPYGYAKQSAATPHSA